MKPITGAFYFLSVSLCLISNPSWAGSESHGGDGVVVGKKVYLLDLYEAGVENTPVINPQFPGTQTMIQRLEQVFSDFEVPAQLLASKISEVESLDFQFGRSMLLAMEELNWNLVSGELVEVPDENSPIDLKKGKHIQLAIRTGKDVLINRDGWRRLTPPHRAALILHETLFAMVKVDSEQIQSNDSSNSTFLRYFQDSRKARSVNGYLFKKALRRNGREGLYARIGDSFDFGLALNPSEPKKGVIMNSPELTIHFHGRSRAPEDSKETWFDFDREEVVTHESSRNEVINRIAELCESYSTLEWLGSVSIRLIRKSVTLKWFDYYEYGDRGTKMNRLIAVPDQEYNWAGNLDKNEAFRGHPETCIDTITAKVDEYFNSWNQ